MSHTLTHNWTQLGYKIFWNWDSCVLKKICLISIITSRPYKNFVDWVFPVRLWSQKTVYFSQNVCPTPNGILKGPELATETI